MRICRLAIALSIALPFGCGSSERPAASDSSSVASSTTSTDPAPLPTGDSSSATAKSFACPRTGLWEQCSVEKRLEQAGFVPRKIASPGPKRAGFSVAPTTYLLGSAQLEVFIYPDEKSLVRDWRELDTLKSAPRGTAPAWPAAPTLVRSANLAALFLSDSPEKSERLALAITAGAPQPAATRAATHVLLPIVHIHPPATKSSR
jgi:hypothetical protein